MSVIKLETLDQSHDWDPDADALPDPHSTGYECRVCRIALCKLCTPEQNMYFDEATKPCPGIPWYEVPDEVSET